MECEEPFVASRENDTEKNEVKMQRKVDRTVELKRLRERYQGRGKEGKSRLLSEFCEQYGYERKYAIKLLGADPQGENRRSPPGPEPKYDGVTEVITQVWQAAEQICGKRLVRRCRFGYRITSGTLGSFCRVRKGFWARSARPRWIAC